MIEPKRKWLYPYAAELEYAKLLKQYAEAVISGVQALLKQRHDDLYADIDRALAALEYGIAPVQAGTVQGIRATAAAVNRFNSNQFHEVVKSAVGMDFVKSEPWLDRALQDWTEENTRLIKDIHADYIKRIQAAVYSAKINGTSADRLAETVAKLADIPKSRADLIAADQLGKLDAMLSRRRQQEIGVKKYRWRGRMDDRERDEHVRREGKIYEWDNPPPDGHPGMPVRCRCRAAMILPELEDIDAQFFGDGTTREYYKQMVERAIAPLPGRPLPENPYQRYQFVPNGTQTRPGYIGRLPESAAASAGAAEKAARTAVSAAAWQVSAVLLEEMKKIESAVTADIRRIAKLAGAKTAGLDNRLKSQTSLQRKIETDALEGGISVNEAASAIKDVLRYTMLFSVSSYAEQYHKTIQMLKNEDYNIVSIKNTWKEGAVYKGINTVVEKDGRRFELQFHTQESFDLKNGELHRLYEEYRLPQTSIARKAVLEASMVILSDNLKIPDGAERLK